MKLISFTRGLMENIGVKLIALVVAMVIWFNASGQQEFKRTFVASLNYINMPDSLTITGHVPSEVHISIDGTRRELLLMRFKKITMGVNMANAVPGSFSQRLLVADLMLPSGVEPGDVRIIAPRSIELQVDRVISKRVYVAVTMNGSPPDGYLLNSPPTAEPAWIDVTGSESAVAPLEKLPTRPIDLSRIREPVQRQVAIEYDNRIFECDPRSVTVNVSVSPRGQRVLANVPPTILMDDDDLQTEVSPKTVSLTLEGPKAVLDTLSSGDVSVLVDLSGKPPGSYTLAPEIIVPNGVESFTSNVDSLRIFITRGSPDQSM